MKLLFVANRVPYPPYRGDKLKIYNLARMLRNEHEIHLITIAESKADLQFRKDLEAVFHKVHVFYLPKWRSLLNTVSGLFGKLPFQISYFRSAGFRTQLQKAIANGNYDGIHVQHLRMSQFVDDVEKSNIILDLPDAFSLYWLRRSQNAKSAWMRIFAKAEYERLLWFEKQMLPVFPLNLVCSSEDMDYLQEQTGARLEVLPNGVDTSQFYPRKEVKPERNRILFTGNMDYEPNVDAVEYFCKELFPEILKANPQARFVIAGQRPVARVVRLASHNIEVTGFIKDLHLEYARASVVVAPLRFGAGTQNKVLESMAMGIPVVCTKVGFKGLGIQSGQGAILAAEKEDFINEVLCLLGDENYRLQISNAGSEYVATELAWSAVSRKLIGYFETLPKRS